MRILFVAAALLIALPAAARDLPVPANKGWQHAETGFTLMPTLDGLPRTALTDATADEYDVAATFATADLSDVITVYLFHPAIDDVAMWFERSQLALENRETYGEVSPVSADPVVFAPPASATASGLRRIYAPLKGPYRATGLAVMPLGDWLVAIRMSSTRQKPAELDARMTRAIAGLRWPPGVAPSPAPVAIAACPAPLVFARAKPVKMQGADMLSSLILSSAASSAAATDRKVAKPAHWCRDAASTQGYGVYRNTDYDKGYTLALADAGRAVFVTPTLDAQLGKGDGYAVSLTDVDGTSTSFPGFAGLPSPAQVIALLDGPRLGMANGKNITINADALRK